MFLLIWTVTKSLMPSKQWRHNGHNGISNQSLTIDYSSAFSGADQRKHKSSASLAFVREIHQWPVNSRTNGQLRGKCFHLMRSSWYPAIINKANLRDLIAATGLVILLKLDSNHRFFSPCDLEIWWMTQKTIGHLFYATLSFLHHS